MAGRGGTYDAVVVGSGPNGLAAAITVARTGRSVLVLEAEATLGGGVRSAELTLPGFLHDTCSAIHPLGIASPFFKSVPLSALGLEWIHPQAPLAHPLDDGPPAMLERSLQATGATLGVDARGYHELMGPLLDRADTLLDAVLGPLLPPRHAIAMARFGLRGRHSALSLAKGRFIGEHARALFAGLGAHSIRPLDEPFTASAALLLGMLAHFSGWPLPRGGSQRIADALAAYLRSIGGEIVTGERVASADDIPPAELVFFDITPRQLVTIAGARLPARYRRKLEEYRYGAGVFKIDWALDGPIPWKEPECLRAATVHLGPTLDAIAAGERQVSRGGNPDRPFVLLAQPSVFDPTRAPAGRHTAWAYCHVPNGSRIDMRDRIEGQVDRFAPGFRDRVLGCHVFTPADLERHNANYIGGDISGGSNDWRQLFARPVLARNPYAIPVKGWYLCSASTPPGAGVHGMCGYNAATAALG